MKTKKTTGYVLIVVAVAIIIIGIDFYLLETRPCVISLERSYPNTVYVPKNNSGYIWLSTRSSSVIINQTFFTTFQVRTGKPINLYLMSEEQYTHWKETMWTDSERNVTDSSNGSLNYLVPRQGKYYFVLDNSGSNESKSVDLSVIILTFLHYVDYTYAFRWLLLATLGLVLYVLGNTLSAYPLAAILRKFDSSLFQHLPSKMNVNTLEKDRFVARKFFWIGFGILSILSITVPLVTFIRSYGYFAIEFPELFTFLIDITIRLFLFFFLTLGLIPPLIMFLWINLLSVIINSVRTYYLRTGKIKSNPELENLAEKIFIRYFVSAQSLFFVVIGIVLCAFGYFEDNHALYFVAMAVFSVPLSRSSFRSTVAAAKELKKHWRTKMRYDERLFLSYSQVFILVLPAFIWIIKNCIILESQVLKPLVIDSLPLPGLTEFISSYFSLTDFEKQVNTLLPNALVLLSFFFAMIIAMTYYIMPFAVKKMKPKKKLGSALSALLLAVACFFVTEAYVNLVYQTTLHSETSLIVSIVVFANTYLLGRMFEELQ